MRHPGAALIARATGDGSNRERLEDGARFERCIGGKLGISERSGRGTDIRHEQRCARMLNVDEFRRRSGAARQSTRHERRERKRMRFV